MIFASKVVYLGNMIVTLTSKNKESQTDIKCIKKKKITNWESQNFTKEGERIDVIFAIFILNN